MNAFQFLFSPAELTVPAGATVTFRNDDDFEHQIQIGPAGGDADADRRSPKLGQGETWTFLTGSAGEVEYFCAIHNVMRGRLLVT